MLSETKKLRVNIDDFTMKCLIGKGFFGEVHLATENVTRDVYAIKKIPKASFAQAKEERNIMAVSRSDWIPALQYAFQVSIFLRYLYTTSKLFFNESPKVVSIRDRLNELFEIVLWPYIKCFCNIVFFFAL